jgi:hypothetical protein
MDGTTKAMAYVSSRTEAALNQNPPPGIPMELKCVFSFAIRCRRVISATLDPLRAIVGRFSASRWWEAAWKVSEERCILYS